MQKTLGGDRLGAGNKMKVNLHNFERSTHDMSYLWRSTMCPGTLVPFLVEVALPGDTFDINMNCEGMTHPTIGPLFGTFKVQLDVFQAPMRLYNALLHNNALGIGLKMNTVKIPQMELKVKQGEGVPNITNPDNSQINPSSLLAYLNVRGIGVGGQFEDSLRNFNAIPLLAYWEIYKQYFSNKVEEIGYMIYNSNNAVIQTIDNPISIGTGSLPGAPVTLHYTSNLNVVINYTGTAPLINQIVFDTSNGEYFGNVILMNVNEEPTKITARWNIGWSGPCVVNSWRYKTPEEIGVDEPLPIAFPLDTIDKMRMNILKEEGQFVVNQHMPLNSPYDYILKWVNNLSPYLGTQQGLGLKTYQSDMFNNWLNTEWIDGVGGINEITSIDTSGGSFTIDTLNLSKKVYDMLNRIAVSGGTYDDWLDAVYAHDRYKRAESPIYHGGLIKELGFQEVISNATVSPSADNNQPLGTLAGRGKMSGKHKGGTVTIKVDEPSYIMGIVSLTPRLDYSQGNKWDVNLKTFDDLHKPNLDEIGFQELITEQMAWWTTGDQSAAGQPADWVQRSAGKQPAWLNYMTNVNVVRGNFAIADNEMFMVLNRRYEMNADGSIKDLTTYIDPTKFNNIFAQTSLDAQNFWMQISVDMKVRRKMSAKLMPNL